jgi:hypothetical protein
MKIETRIVTYNGMGGHPVLSFVGDFLLLEAPKTFGSAITSIEIYSNVRSIGPPKKGQKELLDRFEKRIKKLPLYRFRRKAFYFEIAYVSSLGSAEELFERESKTVSVSLFHDACQEIVSTLTAIKKSLKATDNFDFQAFASHLHRRLDQHPESLPELKRLLGEMKAMERRQREKRQLAARNNDATLEKDAPKSVVLEHDDDAARYVGRAEYGCQYFLTTPFIPASTPGCKAGREFLALYLFDRSGTLRSAIIDDLGPRARMDEAARSARRDELLASLGKVTYQRIKVKPFRVERLGVEFGFIPQPPDGSVEDWCVTVEPGDYMCFWPRWTSGDYET